MLLNYNTVLQEFQYKPNVTFSAYEREGRWWIRIIMLVEDSRAPFQKWELRPTSDADRWFDQKWWDRLPSRERRYSPSREMMEVVGNYMIPPSFFEGDEYRFVEWMVYLIRKVEDHETFEWLRYKGELINDPHKED